MSERDSDSGAETRLAGHEQPETRTVLTCADCEVYWYLVAEEPKCIKPEHIHRGVEIHHHRDVVSLPDGNTLTAVSFDPVDPYTRAEAPEYGLYLDQRWSPPWPHEHVDWPDFGGPTDPEELDSALRALCERIRSGQHVELGCIGGHGRTGTALACLAVLIGTPPSRAIIWVRTTYCPEAIETAAQESFILSAGLEPGG